jgi:proline dehydrogenase
VPPTRHTPEHYGFPVPGPAAPARALHRVLTGSRPGAPQVEDSLRVAAELFGSGFRVALEHRPAPGQDDADAFGELIRQVGAAGLAPGCELTLPVDRLGIAVTRAVAAAAAEESLAVVLSGVPGPVRAAAEGFPGVGVVVRAGQPAAEALCRELGGGHVRLTRSRGADADLAFVRCLNVLMAGTGRPAIAADDPRLVAIAGERAAWNDRTPDSWEHVMSYGVRTEQQRRLVAAGATVRVAVPSGSGARAVPRRLVGRR